MARSGRSGGRRLGGCHLARRVGASPPLVLVGVGVLCAYLPFIPDVRLDSDVALVGVLPPLLYAAAIRTSLVDFRANRSSILLLSIGATLFTTACVALVAFWVIPAPFSVAAAFALGAVVAPPDAVAATSIARRIGLPRRVVSILEGESLVNDATALVALNTARAAIVASSAFMYSSRFASRSCQSARSLRSSSSGPVPT